MIYKNLTANTERTPSELHERACKAGRASGKARAERKQMRQAFDALLSRKETDPENAKHKISGAEFLALKMYQKAAAGDVRAFQLIAEITGEYKQEIKADVKTETVNDRELTPKEAAEFLAELEKII